MSKLITKERLLDFFNDLPTYRQTKILEYLLKKHNLEIVVLNNKQNEILRTINFTNAYIEAFHKNIFPKQGSMRINEINFLKTSGSLIMDTEYCLFELLIKHMRLAPSSIFKEIESIK